MFKLSLGLVALFLILSAIVGGLCWPYAINSWLAFAGKPQVVLFWHGALIGFVPWIGQLSIPAAIITWIAMLFLI
jgi:hypothetical protein